MTRLKMLHQLLHFLFQLFLHTLPATTRSTGDVGSLSSLPPDAVSLLAFKSKADLDNKLLYNTNERFDYCQWQGVKCAQGRVVRYVVQSFGLRGNVPAATLSRLDQLRVLSLRNNSLSGPLPNFSSLINLKTLFLDHNHFFGTFPLSLLILHSLSILDLSFNNFTGLMPENLTVLDRLGYLRLDSNRFHGPIPPLNQTMLEVFNVSSNNLSGPIPVTPTLKKFKASSFLYNPDLCGQIIDKPCRNSSFFNSSVVAPPPTPRLQGVQSQQGMNIDSPPAQKKHHRKVGLISGFVTLAFILLAAVLTLVTVNRRSRQEKEETGTKEETDANAKDRRDTNVFSLQSENAKDEISSAKKLKPYEQNREVKSGSLVFCSREDEVYTLEQLMKASAELLGRGTIGSTYKAVMSNQFTVTVKRLAAFTSALTSSEAFLQHMEKVGVLRHPNLVPVRAYFQAKQERLIVYDFQPNGSLFNLIHASRSSRAKPLHWTSCLKIAEDVAQGLAYVHQASNLIHGNLKSSNVLLGFDFEACITDYCLSILADTSLDDNPDFSSYRAPEIRKSMHKATAKCDVYAFGVLLLELLTGKLPSQHPFLAPPDIADWVQAMREDEGEDDGRVRMLVEVAGLCILASPEQRPTMWQVLKMITSMKEMMDDSPRDMHDDNFL